MHCKLCTAIQSTMLQGLDDDGSASDEPAPEPHESTTNPSQSHWTAPKTGLLPPWRIPNTMLQTQTHTPADAAQQPFTQHLNPYFEHQQLNLPSIPPLLAVSNNSAPQANPPFQHHSMQTDPKDPSRSRTAATGSMPQQKSVAAATTQQAAQTDSAQAGSASPC